MHKRIADAALGKLDGEKAGYFANIVSQVSDDPRTELFPNLVYTVLKETMSLLPTYLDNAEFINLLYTFVDTNKGPLQEHLFDKKYINDPTTIRAVTDGFVDLIVERTMQRYENGEIDSDETVVQKYTWPYRAEDLVDPDDDEAIEELKSRPKYTGPERRER
ncbi:MAG: hypothetical protein OQK35_01925 [Alphaproteobacteria bacterium]|nr:hypothetical protein [Rhodospirillales bacterium]MCW9045067.1 hypothetical protein [Alphaproteobacteria bacterium]